MNIVPIPGVSDVIGLSGKAGSGKTWMAGQLFKYGFKPMAFSWHFKHDALKGGDFSYEDVHYFKPPAARKFLQQIGTEMGREVYGEDVWLRTLYAWMRLLREEHGIRRYVIPDVRFPNEARFVKKLGGKVVRLEHAHSFPYPLAGSDEAKHVSETALDDWREWDMVIKNGPDAFFPADVKVMLYRLGVKE